MIRAGAVDVDGLDALGLPRVALRVARPTGGRRPARVRHTLESHGARAPTGAGCGRPARPRGGTGRRVWRHGSPPCPMPRPRARFAVAASVAASATWAARAWCAAAVRASSAFTARARIRSSALLALVLSALAVVIVFGIGCGVLSARGLVGDSVLAADEVDERGPVPASPVLDGDQVLLPLVHPRDRPIEQRERRRQLGRWRRRRPVPKLGPLEIDHKSAA